MAHSLSESWIGDSLTRNSVCRNIPLNALYQRLFVEAEVGYAVVDSDTCSIVDVNHVVEALTKLSHEQLLHKRLSNLVAANDPLAAQSLLTAVERRREFRARQEFRLKCPGRRSPSVYITVAPLGAEGCSYVLLTIRNAAVGSSSLSRADRMQAARLAQLSPREHDVKDLVVTGLTNQQISHQLGISVKTVESHRRNLMKKLQIDNVVELVRLVLTSDQ